MASKEESINLLAHRILRSFYLSKTETSVEQNLCHPHMHQNSLMCQWVAAEDALEMAWVLDAECCVTQISYKRIISISV